jgi:hypothetical protein
MIYHLSANVIIPGKMAEFQEIVSKELVPLYPKLGMKSVGSFHSYTGNMNEAFGLYAYDDLAAFQKAAEARKSNSGYLKVNAKLNALRVSQTSTILEPNAWSPMK